MQRNQEVQRFQERGALHISETERKCLGHAGKPQGRGGSNLVVKAERAGGRDFQHSSWSEEVNSV